MKTKILKLAPLVILLILLMSSCKAYKYPKHLIITEEEKNKKRELYDSVQYQYINKGLINNFVTESDHKDYTHFDLNVEDLENFIKTAKALDINNKNKTLKFRFYLSAKRDSITNVPHTTLVYSIISKNVNVNKNNGNTQNRSSLQSNAYDKGRETTVLSGNRVGHGGSPPNLKKE